MASGKTHAWDSVIIGLIGGVWLLQSGVPPLQAGLFFLGSISGVLLSPDLDQDGFTKSETIILKRSRVLGWIWFLYWIIYAKLIPHRHWSSHYPIVGTLIRLVYLLPLWVFLFGSLHLKFSPDLLLWVAGLMFSDLGHFLRDGMFMRAVQKQFRSEVYGWKF